MEETSKLAQQQVELQIIAAKQQADFSLTPVGQMVKQFEVMQRMGQMYASSTIIPETYRGNLGNCIIALDIAMRMKINPLMCMQNLYVVQGNPSWSSKFLIATINMSGRYTSLRYRKRNLGKVGKVKYNDLEWVKGADGKAKKTTVVKEFDGSDIDNIECVAYATELSTGEVLESDPVTIELAIKEGWYTKSGSKWVTMPQLMLTYRAAAFWQRAYCPEISMGFMTLEEAEDITDAEYEDLTPSKNAKAKLAELAARSMGLEPERQDEATETQQPTDTGGQPQEAREEQPLPKPKKPLV